MAFHIAYDTITMLMAYAPYAAFTGLFFILPISLYRAKANGVNLFEYIDLAWGRLLLIYMFYIYCFIILGITFLSREPGSRNGMDLIPLSTISPDWRSNLYPIENVVLFIPLGFLLPLLHRRYCKMLPCFGAGFLISLTIEISQLFTRRGFCQTDDVWTNVLGCILGFCAYRVYQYLQVKIKLIYNKSLL